MTGNGCPPQDFRPINALPYWDVIGAFVADAVSDTAAQSGRSQKSLYPAATAFILWCWQSRGTPLERRRIFRRTTLEEFIHLGMVTYAPGSRSTYRSTLLLLVETLNPAEMTRNSVPLPRSKATKPYTAPEISALASWARSQGTPRRQLDSSALLALGLGAGLATRELLGVRIFDVDLLKDNIYVIVRDGRPRIVPVRPDWQRLLRGILPNRDPYEWLFRPGRTNATPNQITDFLLRSRTELDVRPSRMRATWLLAHLAAGTSPRELLCISGLKNLAALDKVASFAPKTRHTSFRSDPQKPP